MNHELVRSPQLMSCLNSTAEAVLAEMGQLSIVSEIGSQEYLDCITTLQTIASILHGGNANQKFISGVVHQIEQVNRVENLCSPSGTARAYYSKRRELLTDLLAQIRPVATDTGNEMNNHTDEHKMMYLLLLQLQEEIDKPDSDGYQKEIDPSLIAALDMTIMMIGLRNKTYPRSSLEQGRNED